MTQSLLSRATISTEYATDILRTRDPSLGKMVRLTQLKVTNKTENKYHMVGTVPTSNSQIIEKRKNRYM